MTLLSEIRSEIRSRLEQAFGKRLRGIVVYGSQARGDAAAGSDLDVLVLLDPPITLGADLETIVKALYPVQMRIEAPIHALPVAITSFEAQKYGLYRAANRDGVFI
jgi:predicted nucleotidyltransferase